MDANTNEIVDTLNLILTKMSTKDDLANLATKVELQSLHLQMREGFRFLHDEVRDVHDRLETIDVELRGHRGYPKEIDHLLARVGAIERHLGIEQKIAA
jgi:hypothetical protein